jgi:exonuclease SbcC
VRILRIRGRNIASLPEFEIDFASGALASAGVFAITGPTGAGKSTILDAMCLALFDRVPRLEARSRSRLVVGAARDGLSESDPRNCMRRGANSALAQVDFEAGPGRRYRATWNVKRAYQKVDGKLGAPTLAFEDLDTGQVLTGASKKETQEAIVKALGLGYEQFCRSVLLAQGEFAQFLRSPANEKAQLLELLTGTELFGEISRAAFRQSREARSEVSTIEREVSALESSLATLDDEEAQGISPERKAEAEAEAEAAVEARDNVGNEGPAPLPPSVPLALTRAHLEERVAAFDAQRTLAETRRREADALLSAARTHAAAESDRTLARESLATMALEHAQALENRVPAHTAAQERAHALEKGEQEHALLASRLRVAHELDARAQEERAALARADAEGARLERELASVVDERALMEAVANLLEESAATDSVETNAIPEGHDTSRADVVSARAAAQLTSTHLAHPLLDPVIAQVRKRERARDALEATRRRGNEEKESAIRAGAAQEDLQDPDARAQGLERERDALESLASVAESVREAHARAHEAMAMAHRHRNEAVRTEADRMAGEAALVLARATLARAEADWTLSVQHDDLRARRGLLVPGEPCPLCGSLDHPAMETQTSDSSNASLTSRLATERAEAAAQVGGRERIVSSSAARTHDLLRAADEANARAERAAQEGARARLRLPSAENFESPNARALRHDAQNFLEASKCEGFPSNAPGFDAWLAEQHGTLEALANVAHAARALAASARELLPRLRALAQMRATFVAQKTALRDDESALGELLHAQAKHASARARALEHRAAELLGALATTRADKETRTARVSALREERDALGFTRPLDDLGREAEAALTRTRQDAEAARRMAAQADATLARVEGARKERERALEQLDARCAELANALPAPARAPHALATLEALFAQAQAEVTRLAAEEGRLKARLEAFVRTEERLAALASSLGRARARAARWDALSEVIGSSDGALFRRKAQSITLEFLLEATNETLERLCPRYRLQRAGGGEMDILVCDAWMDDEPRGVATLSGGETFLVSLALALGLCQLSARHVFLGTLFIDEGFGTLDAATLETTLGMLDALQADGRQVGLISHVPGLAERLAARVVLSPRGQGASALHVEE